MSAASLPPAQFLLQTGTALLLGAAIGVERQWHQGIAGLRTNTLVATASAAFVSLPALLGEDGTGPAHMANYIVSGIGFLGAGAILREGANVHGLNTAATLWATASVGAFVGAGLPSHAAVVTVLILVVNLAMRPLVVWLNALGVRFGTGSPVAYEVEVICPADAIQAVRARLVRRLRHDRFHLRGLRTREPANPGGPVAIVAKIVAPGPNEAGVERLAEGLATDREIGAVSWSTCDLMENDPKLHPGS